jgi:hypothetical protein
LSLRRHGAGLQFGVVAFLGLCGRDVADGLEQAAVVVPVDPFERGELDRLEAAPWPASADDLGLEETVDRLGECVVVAVADATDGGLDPRLGEALGVLDRDILDATDALLFVKPRCILG